MAPVPQKAMVLAAGLGKRMLPLTRHTPKPLITVWHKTMLDHALDALAEAGVGRAIVNVHHLADQIVAHVSDRKSPSITISDEKELLLDSGGGTAKALDLLGPSPFFLLNADSFWIDGKQPNLRSLSQAWDGDRMDILLLLAMPENSVGFGQHGDFFMASSGQLTRRGDKPFAPFAYTGAAIFSPAFFVDCPDEPFSLNLLFDRAIASGRLFGLELDGLWLHVGTKEAIGEAEQAIEAYYKDQHQ